MSNVDRRTFEATEPMTHHPPRWHGGNKLVAARLSYPPCAEHRSMIRYRRRAAIDVLGQLVATDGIEAECLTDQLMAHRSPCVVSDGS